MTISDDLTQGEIRKLYGCYNTNKQTKAKIKENSKEKTASIS